MSFSSISEILGYQVEGTADWRREKAKEFPNDAARNLEAAQELDQLAAEIKALEGSEIHTQISELLDTLPDDAFSHWPDVSEALSAELRSVGFHTRPRSIFRRKLSKGPVIMVTSLRGVRKAVMEADGVDPCKLEVELRQTAALLRAMRRTSKSPEAS